MLGDINTLICWGVFHSTHVLMRADVGRVAVGICYDIRFPEMAMLYASRGSPFLLSCSFSSHNFITMRTHRIPWQFITISGSFIALLDV